MRHKKARTFVKKGLLIHASPDADLATLKPFTIAEKNKALYATCCPIFATLHVLKNKYGHSIFLRQYRFFSASLTLCRIHNKAFDEVISLKLTHYFVGHESFIRDAIKISRIEKLTLGLIKNTKTVYTTNKIITPASKKTITLKDITAGKFFRIYKHHVYANFTWHNY